MEVADHTKYLMSNAVKYLLQRVDEVEALWGAIYNAWVRNDVACHLHVQLEACGPNLHAHDFCIVFGKPIMAGASRNVHVNEFAPEAFEELEEIGVPVSKYRYRGYYPMFIGVGELAKPHQVVHEQMRLVETTAVGLMPLDSCPMFRRDVLASPVSRELLGRVGDRELD